MGSTKYKRCPAKLCVCWNLVLLAAAAAVYIIFCSNFVLLFLILAHRIRSGLSNRERLMIFRGSFRCGAVVYRGVCMFACICVCLFVREREFGSAMLCVLVFLVAW